MARRSLPLLFAGDPHVTVLRAVPEMSLPM
jgi:hypothetical protein